MTSTPKLTTALREYYRLSERAQDMWACGAGMHPAMDSLCHAMAKAEEEVRAAIEEELSWFCEPGQVHHIYADDPRLRTWA